MLFIIECTEEGGFVAKAIGHPMVMEAGTLDGIKDKIKDAVKCRFKEKDLPLNVRLHMVKDEVIAL
jgi:hypothetical protein